MNKVVQLFWGKERREGKRKQKQPKDTVQNPQYICQYKSQNKVPNTFSNTKSIAHKDSLHNQLKKFIHYPSTVEGGGLVTIASLLLVFLPPF